MAVSLIYANSDNRSGFVTVVAVCNFAGQAADGRVLRGLPVVGTPIAGEASCGSVITDRVAQPLVVAGCSTPKGLPLEASATQHGQAASGLANGVALSGTPAPSEALPHVALPLV